MLTFLLALKGVAVLELYTSEGCSSCPPADALLARLADRPGVVAVELHVDYWNKLGWRDPFSDKAFSARQEALGGDIYTPELVVNGGETMVGSDEEHVVASMDKALAVPATATLTLAVVDGKTIKYASAGAAKTGATITIAVVTPSATTKVERGENAGRTLRHVNVARWLTVVPAGSGTVESPVPVEKIVGWVSDDAGHVIGAFGATPAQP